MSYVVSIRRRGGHGISSAELRALAESDATLREVPYDQAQCEGADVEFEWVPGNGMKPVSFVVQRGEVTVTTPSHAALRKMQELARFLEASVIGEEGEDLTLVDVPEWELSPGTSLSGCAVVVLAVAGLLWWWLSS